MLTRAFLVVLLAIAFSCKRGEGVNDRPTASLADTTAAGRVFEHLRTVWLRNEPNDRPALRHDLEAFIQTFPKDGLVPLARAYWILSLMDPPADWARADRLLESSTPPAHGSTHDLYVVANAKLLRYHHQPEVAFGLLRPIVGKMVDGRARALLQEELTFDALEAREPYEAIAYMDGWLRGATEEDRAASEAKVAVALGAVPEAALHGSLQDMRASAKRGESHGYGIAIERLVGERLGQIAVEHGDAALARWLLDADEGTPVLSEEMSSALSRLATSKRGLGNVAGRTVGLVLPTSSADLRDESADVLRGVLWALDLARDERGAGPRADAVRLVTRDDGGDKARLRTSLEEVAGEGASVIVTALDSETADEALAWSASSSISVITLAMPSEGNKATGAPGFTVGEDWRSELALLTAALVAMPTTSGSARSASSIATIADSEAIVSLAGASDRTDAGSPPTARTACDTAFSSAGESRFPFAAWDKAGISAWIVAGSPACADDLFHGLTRLSRRAAVGLALEASETSERPRPGVRLLTVAAGVVPLASVPNDDPRALDVREMVAKTGAPPRWWTALGRDASILARRALATLPTDTTEAPPEIARRRALVRRSLHEVKAPLWTSERDGFDAAGVVTRTFRTVDLSR
jgi:hypothetical protein